jgi:hypothetical protein
MGLFSLTLVRIVRLYYRILKRILYWLSLNMIHWYGMLYRVQMDDILHRAVVSMEEQGIQGSLCAFLSKSYRFPLRLGSEGVKLPQSTFNIGIHLDFLKGIVFLINL